MRLTFMLLLCSFPIKAYIATSYIFHEKRQEPYFNSIHIFGDKHASNEVGDLYPEHKQIEQKSVEKILQSYTNPTIQTPEPMCFLVEAPPIYNQFTDLPLGEKKSEWFVQLLHGLNQADTDKKCEIMCLDFRRITGALVYYYWRTTLPPLEEGDASCPSRDSYYRMSFKDLLDELNQGIQSCKDRFPIVTEDKIDISLLKNELKEAQRLSIIFNEYLARLNISLDNSIIHTAHQLDRKTRLEIIQKVMDMSCPIFDVYYFTHIIELKKDKRVVVLVGEAHAWKLAQLFNAIDYCDFYNQKAPRVDIESIFTDLECAFSGGKIGCCFAPPW